MHFLAILTLYQKVLTYDKQRSSYGVSEISKLIYILPLLSETP